MKKLVKLLMGIAVLSLFYTCGKKRQVKIEGRVYNPITQEGISGAELWLLKSGSITEYYGGYERVTTVYTAADGSFKVDLKSAKAEILRLGDMHGEYYKIGWYENGALLPSDLTVKKGKTMHADFYAVPYGKLHWHIKNVNCEGITDSLWFKKKYEYGDDFIAGWEFANPFVGCTDFSGNGTDKEQMGNHIIKMKIKRQSGTVIKYDTVFVNKDGITYYELFY